MWTIYFTTLCRINGQENNMYPPQKDGRVKKFGISLLNVHLNIKH